MNNLLMHAKAGDNNYKMLKWEKRDDTLHLQRNHHAAHVEIQIKNQNGDGWTTVPGAWLIPTSAAEANGNGARDIGTGIWHELRKELTGENSVTAIQLPYIRKRSLGQLPERTTETLRTKLSHRPNIFCLPRQISYHQNDAAKAEVVNLPWQKFAASSAVMSWSYLAKTYNEIETLVTNKELEFKIVGQCQIVTTNNCLGHVRPPARRARTARPGREQRHPVCVYKTQR